MHISVCHKIMPVKDCFIFQRQERHSRQILYIYKCNTLGNESYRKVKPRLYAFDLHKIILFTGTIHTRRPQDHIREMRLVAHIALRFQLTFTIGCIQVVADHPGESDGNSPRLPSHNCSGYSSTETFSVCNRQQPMPL